MTIPPDSDASGRSCEKCGAEMKLLGRLPRRPHQPAKSVFRCYRCNHVVQDGNAEGPWS